MFDTTNQGNEQSISDSGIDISNSDTGDRYQYSTPEVNKGPGVFASDSPCTLKVNGGDILESVQPAMHEESSSVGPRGKRYLSSLYDETFPIDLEYSGLCLLGEEEPSSYEEAKTNPS
jgi:hypothetical protein